MRVLIGRTKNIFGIKNEIVLQAYDDDWKEWVDLHESNTLRDHQKLRVAIIDTVLKDVVDVDDNKVF